MTESKKKSPPPAPVIAVAVICGLLAVPMLAAAGSLAALAVSSPDLLVTFILALFAIGVLATAGVNLVGALHILQRGRPRLAQLGGYLTIGVTALMLIQLLVRSAAGASFVVPLIFLPTAIAMLSLLGTRRTRLWLAARSRTFEMTGGSRQPVRLGR